MKKKLVLSLMITFGLHYAQAQQPNTQENLQRPKIIPSSPQSQIFENYLNHEVTEYNGLPKIEIPLYEIKMKDLTIPINLSYHASGIKYMQYDGDIGAGWSIGAGGYRLTRSVRGADDFAPVNTQYPAQYYQSVKKQEDMNIHTDPRRKDNFLYFLSFDPDRPLDVYPKGVFAGMPNGVSDAMYGDGQYDKFQYMLPSTSGSFIIKDRPTMQVALMDDKRDKVEIQRQQCKITDANGIEYFIGGTDNGMELFEKEVTTFHETTWVLREIKTPSNETVHFRYKRIWTVNQRFKENRSGVTVSDAPFYTLSATSWGGSGNLPFHTDGWTISNIYSGGPKYEVLLFLDEIETENLLVKFERGVLLDMGHILKKIIVTDKLSHKVINEIELFNYVYPSTVNTLELYKTTASHIYLNAVNTLGNTYNLDYYTPPSNISNPYPDQWNNYNFKQGFPADARPILHQEFLDEEFVWNRTYGDDQSWTVANNKSTIRYSGIDVHSADRSVDEDNVMSYSLEKIHFPTGGNTEYVYETHQTVFGKGGGLRIKKIISSPDPASTPVISEFRYSNGVSSFKLDHNAFSSESYSINHEKFSFGVAFEPWYLEADKWIGRISCNRTFSMNPVGDYNLSEYNTYYRNVDVLQYDLAGNKYNGKRSVEYNLPSFPQLGFYDGAFLGAGGFAYPTVDNYNKRKGIMRTYDGQKPTLKSTAYFDELGQLLKKETYKYKKVDSNNYYGLKVNQRFYISSGEVPTYPQYNDIDLHVTRNDYTHVSSYFDWMAYEIETGTDILISKTDSLFTPSGQIVRTESFEHNDDNQVTKITLSDNADGTGKIKVTELKYPKDFASGSNVYQQLVDRHIIAPVVETIERTGTNQELKRNKTEYNAFGSLLLPSRTTATTQGLERIIGTYNMYDSKGNLLQYTPFGANSIFYLWSYNHRYPVAEIRNVNIGELEYALYSRYGTSLQAHAGTSAPVFDDALLRSDLPNALITTYTYDPSIGISSIKDPRGRRTRYIYDNFNRLKYVEDHEGRLVNEYGYHYRSGY